MNKKMGWLVTLLVLSAVALMAQGEANVRYIYDEAGNLAGVIDANGNAKSYTFDAAGRLTAVERLVARGPVDIFFLDPPRGSADLPPDLQGTTVRIYGIGFSALAADNQVFFGEVPAPVESASPTLITTRVPAGARTGRIRVASPAGSSESRGNFLVNSRIVTINNPGAPLTDYPIAVPLDTASLVVARQMRPDGSDIRVLDSDQSTQLSYWIDGIDTATTAVWVMVPSIPTGNKTVSVHYGYASAAPLSNGRAVFTYFDDFQGTTLQKGWTFWNPGGDDSFSLTERRGWMRIKVVGDSDTWETVNQAPHLHWTHPEPNSNFALQTRTDAEAMGFANQYNPLAYIRSFAVGRENKGHFGPFGQGQLPTRVIFSADGFGGNPCETQRTMHYVRFRRMGSTLFSDWSNNGVTWNACSSYTLPSSPLHWGLAAKSYQGGGSFDADFDYFFVRKLASPEPTITVSPE